MRRPRNADRLGNAAHDVTFGVDHVGIATIASDRAGLVASGDTYQLDAGARDLAQHASARGAVRVDFGRTVQTRSELHQNLPGHRIALRRRLRQRLRAQRHGHEHHEGKRFDQAHTRSSSGQWLPLRAYVAQRINSGDSALEREAPRKWPARVRTPGTFRFQHPALERRRGQTTEFAGEPENRRRSVFGTRRRIGHKPSGHRRRVQRDLALRRLQVAPDRLAALKNSRPAISMFFRLSSPAPHDPTASLPAPSWQMKLPVRSSGMSDSARRHVFQPGKCACEERSPWSCR